MLIEEAVRLCSTGRQEYSQISSWLKNDNVRTILVSFTEAVHQDDRKSALHILKLCLSSCRDQGKLCCWLIMVFFSFFCILYKLTDSLKLFVNSFDFESMELKKLCSRKIGIRKIVLHYLCSNSAYWVELGTRRALAKHFEIYEKDKIISNYFKIFVKNCFKVQMNREEVRIEAKIMIILMEGISISSS